MKLSHSRLSVCTPRRRFVQGLAACGVMVGLTPVSRAASLLSGNRGSESVPVLEGTEFNLEIGEAAVNFTGTTRIATTINGSIPGPTLKWREGDTVTLRVKNNLKVSSSIHWHGIILPYQMDGVPGISFPGIAPGETYVYRFKVQQNGTYWYHSHSGMQEATGMYGAIIVEPNEKPSHRVDRDYVVQLSDWTDDDPMSVLAKLKAQSDYYNYNKPTATGFVRDAQKNGLSSALDKRQMWNQMRMSPTDLADVSSSVLTYLMNGKTPAANWTGLFKPGERVRLRFINGSANTIYDVRIPGLKLTVIQADGQNVDPVTVDEFRFGPGQTYDAIVQPHDDAYTLFAQSMDRSGYACGTLCVREGLRAPVPKLDPVQWLTMEDMMGTMGSMAGMSHSGMGGRSSTTNMDHSGMMAMGAMDHGAMPGMNHGAMATMAQNTASTHVRHARSEYGPSVDMRVNTPRTNLDDPGVGLRNNGRRVLTLADLHTTGGALDPRGAEREIELHLTGNMERYIWSFDGVEFGDSTPVHFRYGERLRVILHNDTMMTHPMHLHGVWSELEAPNGNFQARLHTIPVQPAQRISFLVTADALGRWAWHCHLLFHMHMGMFREVVTT